MSSQSVPHPVALPILCPFELELEHNILQDQFDMTHEDQTSMYQNECFVGNTWCAFKSIKTVQLDKNFTMAFSLEWENKESIDHTVLISAKELQHHRKTTEWARRFDGRDVLIFGLKLMLPMLEKHTHGTIYMCMWS